MGSNCLGYLRRGELFGGKSLGGIGRGEVRRVIVQEGFRRRESSEGQLSRYELSLNRYLLQTFRKKRSMIF